MSEKRSATFGRLLKAGLNSISTLEGKTGPILDDEIGDLVALAGPALQRYRSGAIPGDHTLTHTLAVACVERSCIGRRWLEHCLEAARYPAHEARALVGRLFPEPERTGPRGEPRPNLPAPTYIRFGMRRAAYDAVLAGLRGDLSATLIVSLGGMGKTSLARACVAAGESLALASDLFLRMGMRREAEAARRELDCGVDPPNPGQSLPCPR